MVRSQAGLLKLQHPGAKNRELGALRAGCLSGQDLVLPPGPAGPTPLPGEGRAEANLGARLLSPQPSILLAQGALSQVTPWKVVLIQKGPQDQLLEFVAMVKGMGSNRLADFS